MMDLHVHSIFSDGKLKINELIDDSVKNGVNVLSVTDHDTIEGIEEYKKNYLTSDIMVIPGVEFSTETYYLGKRTKIHLLGYGYQIDDIRIKNVLGDLYKRRHDDNKEYIDWLIKKFPYLSSEFFIGFDYGKYGWIHKYILNYIDKHLDKDQLSFLKEYLINNKPIYNKYNESVEDMISLLHLSKGYAVFAHPQKCDISWDELEKLIRYLINLGLDGIETYHAESNDYERSIIHSYANKYGLYETGGSDFHSFQYGQGVGYDINFPQDYDPLLVKKLIKERKVLGDINAR